MIPQERFDAALRSGDVYEALRESVLQLAQEGHGKEEIYAAFEQLLLRIRAQHQGSESEEEDIVLDVMDTIVGWCSPNKQLL